jgi:hypothetical protein
MILNQKCRRGHYRKLTLLPDSETEKDQREQDRPAVTREDPQSDPSEDPAGESDFGEGETGAGIAVGMSDGIGDEESNC